MWLRKQAGFREVVMIIGGICALLAFADASAEKLGTNPVTFQVNMSIQILEQKFDPKTDFVLVRGSFNQWTLVDTLVDSDGDSIYTKIIAFSDSLVGQMIEFKYYYQHNGVEVWENDPRRTYVVPAGGGAVPLDYFDRDSQYDSPFVDVTFQVNMRMPMLEGRFDVLSDGVFVRGTFNNGVDESLYDTDGDSIYTRTLSLPDSLVGKNIEYRFGFTRADSTVLEADPVRKFVLSDSDTVLPVASFDRDSVYHPILLPIDFSVDMSIRLLEGGMVMPGDFTVLDITAEGLEFRTTMSDADGDSVYSATVPIESKYIGHAIQYKFGYIHNGEEIWESDPPRVFVVPFGGGAAPLDFFDRDSIVHSPQSQMDTATVTFRVNMKPFRDSGLFSQNDSLFLKAGFNQWQSGRDAFQADGNDPDVFVLHKSVTAAADSLVEFLLTLKVNGVEVDDWYGIRRFRFTGDDLILPEITPVFTNPAPVTAQVRRVFILNAKPLLRKLAAEGRVIGDQDTVTQVQTITLLGPDLNNWRGANAAYWQLRDDGSLGDAVPGDSLFTGSFNFSANWPQQTVYKYYVNGKDVESRRGRFHYLQIDASTLADTVFDVFGSPDTLYANYTRDTDWVVAVRQADSGLPMVYRLLSNYPNPFNPETVIPFELPHRQHVVITIYNMMGQEIIRLVDRTMAAGRYQVKWSGKDAFGRRVPSGVYVYKMTAGPYQKTLKMLLLK